jgi:protein-L-isoaspartate(D-aspartate) O-methyltransferase
VRKPGFNQEMAPSLAGAFAAVPRENFLPESARSDAEHDGPIPIGRGQTNSQPRTVAAMLQLLDVRPGQRVLDVGAGSGWTTALIAHLVGTSGLILGVELEPELASWGAANLARWQATQRAIGGDPPAPASVRPSVPGVLGAPDEGPWDRILVSANARSLPDDLVAQLTPADGRLVVPVRSRMTLAIRHGDEVTTSYHGAYRFVPLR